MKKDVKQATQITQDQIALERIRRSKQELVTELRSRGMEAGRDFVLKDRDASAACHRNLERADTEDTQFNCFADLVKVLSGDERMENDWGVNFQARYGHGINQPEWVEGFFQGALEKFRELEEKL